MKHFADSHEWIEVEDGVGSIGISVHAAKELGDVTFVELPEVGAVLQVGDILGSVESVKAASDLYAPVGCVVVEVNDALESEPEIINQSPEKDGWVCRVKDMREEDFSSLKSAAEYVAFVSEDGDPQSASAS